MQAVLTLTYEVDGKAISAQETVTAHGEYKKDFELEPGETVEFPLAIDKPLTEAIVIIPTTPVSLKVNDQPFELKAQEGLMWTRQSGLPYPFKGDVKRITVTNLGDKKGILQVRVPERSKPVEEKPAEQKPAAPVAVAIDTPAPMHPGGLKPGQQVIQADTGIISEKLVDGTLVVRQGP